MEMPFVLTVCVILVLIIKTEAKSITNGSELEELKEAVFDLSTRLQALNASLQSDKNRNVMFYAVIRGKTINLNVDSILVFETVIVNEGGHYDRFDGVFVAPQKGIYLFSWTVSGTSSNYIVTELVVEENVISATGEQNGGGGLPSGSMTALCKMEKGNHAWIRTTGASSTNVIHSHDNNPQTGFLGLLVKII